MSGLIKNTDIETIQWALWLSEIKGLSPAEVENVTGLKKRSLYNLRRKHGLFKERYEKTPDICARCEILLSSKHAGEHDGKHCEGCLKELAK